MLAGQGIISEYEDEGRGCRLFYVGLLPLREGRRDQCQRGQALRAPALLRLTPGPRQGAGEWGSRSRQEVTLPRPRSLSPAEAPSSLQA